MTAFRPLALAGIAAIAIALAWPAAAPTPALAQTCKSDPAGPRGTVDRLHEALIDVMKNAKTLGLVGRRERLDPVVRRAFALPDMARLAVGPYWQQMSAAEQKSIVESFSRMSVAIYARRFNGFDGESFEFLAQEPGPRDTTWIRTRIVVPSSENVALNYLTRDFCDQGWRIVDVFLAGSISELATRRSEYTSVLRQSGVAGLIAALEEKINEAGR